MLAWLERYQLLLLLAAVVLLVAGVVARELEADEARRTLVFQEGTPLEDGAPIRVQVAGAVQSPGVYDLLAGDRVVDAIEAAGGAASDARLDELNLARRLRDGEKLSVPGPPGPRAPVPTLAPGARLDINTATQAQLDQLPGIGEAYSRRIVDSRRVDGPYRSIDDLVTRGVLPRATFELIRDRITTGPQ